MCIATLTGLSHQMADAPCDRVGVLIFGFDHGPLERLALVTHAAVVQSLCQQSAWHMGKTHGQATW